MFDSVAISKSFGRSLDVDLLVKNGCKPFFRSSNGEPYKLVINAKKNSKKPRITITRAFRYGWILKAETSIGAWLFDSNIFLPNENDLESFMCLISEYIGDKTGLRFNARNERISRLDITRDFPIGEDKILSAIKQFSGLKFPKYDRKPINQESLYFENKGNEKNKKYAVYSKYLDFIDKQASPTELELAKGILRLEIQHKNTRAVTNLANSLRLPNHDAGTMLNANVSETVIQKTMDLMNFDAVLDEKLSSLEKLSRMYKSSKLLTLAGHLAFKAQYGNDYGDLSFINLSKDTLKKYDRECAKAGSLSLYE